MTKERATNATRSFFAGLICGLVINAWQWAGDTDLDEAKEPPPAGWYWIIVLAFVVMATVGRYAKVPKFGVAGAFAGQMITSAFVLVPQVRHMFFWPAMINSILWSALFAAFVGAGGLLRRAPSPAPGRQ